MGISRTTIQMLLEEAHSRPFHGAVATLGRQHIYFSWDEFRGLASKFNVPVRTDRPPSLHRQPELARQGFVSDDTIFYALGFSEIIRVDVSDYEHVDELFDLNSETTPQRLCNRFDLIVDTGTLEHLFHLPNALANLHHMLTATGTVFHLTPSANCMDHGFYGISPTFYYDYYSANRYTVQRVAICRYSSPTPHSRVEVYDYLQPHLRGFELGGLDHRYHACLAIAQRGPESSCRMIPQQASYRERWDASQFSEPDASPTGLGMKKGKAERLLQWTSGYPRIQGVAERLITKWRGFVHRYRCWKQPIPLRRVREYR